MSIMISDGDYIRFENEGKLFAVMFREDMEPDNPRNWDNLGEMICWHKKYNLGDRHGYRDPEDFFREQVCKLVSWETIVCKIREGRTYLRVTKDEESGMFSLSVSYTFPFHGEYEVCEANTEEELFNKRNQDAIIEEITASQLCLMLQESGQVIMMPLWLYDHSGISMSTSHVYPYNDQWDSGQVGWIYLTKDRFLQETGYGEAEWPKKAYEMLENEVKTYDQYLRGETYGFQMFEFNRNGTDEWDETDETCWGFYGDDLLTNGMLEYLPDLAKALESDEYTEGRAREVTTVSYEFD